MSLNSAPVEQYTAPFERDHATCSVKPCVSPRPLKLVGTKVHFADGNGGEAKLLQCCEWAKHLTSKAHQGKTAEGRKE